MFKKVLVPLDGSRLAEKVLPQVERISRCCQPEVHLFQVVVTYEIEPEKEKAERARLLRDAWQYLEKVAARLRKKKIKAHAVVAYGKDAVQICEYARKNRLDLIIMATHGRSGFSRWALGSVADKVLNCSHVPVLLVRVS